MLEFDETGLSDLTKKAQIIEFLERFEPKGFQDYDDKNYEHKLKKQYLDAKEETETPGNNEAECYTDVYNLFNKQIISPFETEN